MTKEKAWIVSNRFYEYVAVVFAETRGKARELALCTGYFEDCRFIDISAVRLPEADHLCPEKGFELDWDIPEHREMLYKIGYRCLDSALKNCIDCPCKDYCEDVE